MDNLKAGQGRHVVVELVMAAETDHLEFDIVPDEYADFEAGYLGAGTPLARAITGLFPGESAPYRVGDARLVKVVAVVPAAGPPPKEIAARRAETLRKAVDQSDRTNAMMFASSFSGKWGDYDPAAFSEEQNPEDPPDRLADDNG
jgi:hypothetical protein